MLQLSWQKKSNYKNVASTMNKGRNSLPPRKPKRPECSRLSQINTKIYQWMMSKDDNKNARQLSFKKHEALEMKTKMMSRKWIKWSCMQRLLLSEISSWSKSSRSKSGTRKKKRRRILWWRSKDLGKLRLSRNLRGIIIKNWRLIINKSLFKSRSES
jgi:hypothetical protein